MTSIKDTSASKATSKGNSMEWSWIPGYENPELLANQSNKEGE